MAEDVIYVLLLAVGIILGPFIRKISDFDIRQKCSALAGFAIVAFALGFQAVHPLVLVLGNSCILLLLNRRTCHILSFVFCFTYITMVRFGEYVGLPGPPCYGSAIQMYICLKMVGLSFDVHDNDKKECDNKKMTKGRLSAIELSLTDIICYSFCHAGVLTGPYYSFQTFLDSMHRPSSTNVQWLPNLVNRLKFVPIYIVMIALLRHRFSIEHVLSDEMMQRSFWYRAWFAALVAYAYRLRLVTMFLMSEGQCIASGIGAYPKRCRSKPGHGPTESGDTKATNGYKDKGEQGDQAMDFQTVCSLNLFKVESALVNKDVISNWNMTVQYWLYAYVYRRLPMAKKLYRFSLTLLLSAFWHGIEPAYYVCTLSQIVMCMAEEVTVAPMYENATSFGRKIVFVIFWPLRQLVFLYLTMTFLVLDTAALFRCYCSLYFYGHAAIAVACLLGFKFHKKQKVS